MIGNAVLDLLKTNLQAAMPGRIVTRSAKDFAQRQSAEIAAGVVTLVSINVADLASQRDLQDFTGKLNILLMVEFKLAESAPPEQVEVAEWAAWEEIKAFIKAPGAGLCPLDATRLTFSAQSKAPWGWIAVELEYSELD